MRRSCDTDRPDARIARFAAPRHGVLDLDELLSLGLSHDAVHRRARAGRLHRVHHRVYAVGHPRLTERGLWRAAVLASGPGATLSHLSAASLCALRRAGGGLVHVTVPSTAGMRAPRGVHLHRSGALDPADVVEIDHIRCTTWARTLLDLAAVLDRHRLRSAMNEAEVQRIFDRAELEACLARHPRRHGAPKLRALLAERLEPALTQTELEVAMAAVCRDHGLPVPTTQAMVHGCLVDFWWPEHRLVVETDSWRYHRVRRRFEDDRARDARLLALGIRTLRFTYRQVTEDRAAVAATLSACMRVA